MTEESIQPPAEEIAEDYKEKYLRLLAEIDNTRKRMQKEKQEMTRFAVENVIGEILTPIDNLENALQFTQHMSDEVRNWAQGFQMILGQFKEVLHNYGVVAFHSEGNTFDPLYHEAVEIVESTDYPDGSILHEFTKGYKSAARTIRPARVKVAKHPQKSEIPAESAVEETTTQN